MRLSFPVPGKIQTVIFLFLIIDITAFAQGGHYWTEQYGNRSMLMSGSVVGGVNDLGAVFYNPGRLALSDNPVFLVSANLYQLENLRITNALGPSRYLESKKIGAVPGLVAGTFKLPFMPNHHFAYALLTRTRMNLDFETRAEKQGDIFEETEGDETFAGLINLQSEFKDEWLSVSWSHLIQENLSIGITTAYTKSKSMKNIASQYQLLYNNNKNVAQFTTKREVGFNHNGLLWKIGLAWETRFAEFGFTVTTPKINLNGSGNYIYEDFLSGLPESVQDDHFESSIQNDLPARNKTPLSIGGGATFKIFDKHFLHLSGEWFSRVPKYTILSANSFIGQSTGNRIQYTLFDEAKSIFNYGVGMEVVLRENINFYSSFSMDKSYVPGDVVRLASFGEETSNSNFRANIRHVGSGFSLNLKKADVTLGVTYAWAKESFPQPLDFPIEGEEEIYNADDDTEFRWDRWRFIFSFSFPFLKDVLQDFKGESEPDGK